MSHIALTRDEFSRYVAGARRASAITLTHPVRMHGRIGLGAIDGWPAPQRYRTLRPSDTAALCLDPAVWERRHELDATTERLRQAAGLS